MLTLASGDPVFRNCVVYAHDIGALASPPNRICSLCHKNTAIIVNQTALTFMSFFLLLRKSIPLQWNNRQPQAKLLNNFRRVVTGTNKYVIARNYSL